MDKQFVERLISLISFPEAVTKSSEAVWPEHFSARVTQVKNKLQSRLVFRKTDLQRIRSLIELG